MELSGPHLARTPKFARCFGLDDDEAIWIAGAVVGNEDAVFLCATYDGQAVVICEKRKYFRSEWLKAHYPQHRDVVEIIERLVIEHFANKDAP
jgi:hypothetical protein